MDQKVFRQVRGERFNEVLPAFGMFMDDYSRDPETLWELLAYLQETWPQDQRLIAAVYERAKKYEPRRACGARLLGLLGLIAQEGSGHR